MVGIWITYFTFFFFFTSYLFLFIYFDVPLNVSAFTQAVIWPLFVCTVQLYLSSSWTLLTHKHPTHGQWWSCRGVCVCVFVIVCVCFGTWEITHYILACTGRQKSEILACLAPSSFSCASNLWPLSDSSKRNERELLFSPAPPWSFISENRNSVWTQTEMTD